MLPVKKHKIKYHITMRAKRPYWWRACSPSDIGKRLFFKKRPVYNNMCDAHNIVQIFINDKMIHSTIWLLNFVICNPKKEIQGRRHTRLEAERYGYGGGGGLQPSLEKERGWRRNQKA
ncbi:hypothetical protein LXL04_024479 [Taraxacum kok-saghyz]